VPGKRRSLEGLKRKYLVLEVLDFLREHEHNSDVLEERWRNGFSDRMAALDQKVEHKADSLEKRVDQRVDGLEAQLAQLVLLAGSHAGGERGDVAGAAPRLAVREEMSELKAMMREQMSTLAALTREKRYAEHKAVLASSGAGKFPLAPASPSSPTEAAKATYLELLKQQSAPP